MYRIFQTTIGFIGLVALGACGSGEPASDVASDAVCTPAGHWLAEEERAGGDCAPDRVPARSVVIEIDELDMTDGDNLWRFTLTRGGERFTTCSGVPSDDHCRIEITCNTDEGERRLEYALTLELNEMNALAGSGILKVPYEVDETCQAQFDLDGEQVSPLELEGAEQQR